MSAGNRKRRAKPRIDNGRAHNRVAPRCPETGKRSWRSEAAALRAAAAIASNTHHPMRPYLCPFCGYTHLTSKPKR